MRKKSKKIRLQKETLLSLSPAGLEGVDGAAAPPTWSACPTISCMSCGGDDC